MTQNSMRLQWTNDEVEKRLHQIMIAIHNQCVRCGEQEGYINYVDGANIAGSARSPTPCWTRGLFEGVAVN